MTVSLKVASIPLLITMALASGSVLADGLFQNLIRDRIHSDTSAVTGHQFSNFERTDRLRHRVNPLYLHHGQAHHQYRYREQSSGPHRHQSGSMSRGSSRGSGGGSKGGGGRGR